MSPPAAACQNHRDREAIGVCVRCRARICSECVTKVEGINHCVACYGAVADEGARRAQRREAPTPAWRASLSALALLILLTFLTWGMLEVALPGGAAP